MQPRVRKKIELPDLINGGALYPGMSLFPRRKKHSHKVATLLQDGQVEVDGIAYSSASDAANAIAGKRTNGWWFFLTDQASRQTLRRVRDDYVNAMAVDVEDDEADDDKMRSRIFQRQESIGLSCSSAPCLGCAMGTSCTLTASNTVVVNSGGALSFQ